MQPPAGVADLFGELPFDPGVDVLVPTAYLELSRLDPQQQGTEAFEDRPGRCGVDHPGLEEHPGVGQTPHEVRRREPVVERQRPRVRVDDRIDLRFEGAAPEAGRGGLTRSSRVPGAQAAASSSAWPRMPTARSISGSWTTSGGSMRMLCGRGALTSRPFSRQRFATAGASGVHSIAVISP